MKTLKSRFILGCLLLVSIQLTFAQNQTDLQTSTSNGDESTMKTYLIEREIPDAGLLTAEELKGISQKSCGVLKEMGPEIQWLHSYVTDDKVYCLYKAKNEELIREHGEKGGFPVNNITELSTVINPATAEWALYKLYLSVV